jgi:hypothetical protein
MKNSITIKLPHTFKNWTKLFRALTISGVLFLLLQSCSKDAAIEPETPVSGNVNQEQYIKCKIDGVDFLSKDDTRFNYARVLSVGGLTAHQLRGASEATEAILLTFYDFSGVGVYNMDDPNVNTTAQWLTVNPYATYDCSQANAGITSGKIEVTFQNSERIEGTFAFTAVDKGNISDKVTITDGEFRLNY